MARGHAGDDVLTRGSVLHDGHPKALWKLTKHPKTHPVLEITPFTPLTPQAWTSIETEAQTGSSQLRV